MKQLLKYPGSKFRAAKWIISHFPEHHNNVKRVNAVKLEFAENGIAAKKKKARKKTA